MSESIKKLREIANAALNELKGRLVWSPEEYSVLREILSTDSQEKLPNAEQVKSVLREILSTDSQELPNAEQVTETNGTVTLESFIKQLSTGKDEIGKKITEVHNAFYDHLITGFENIQDGSIQSAFNENSKKWTENVITWLSLNYFGQEMGKIVSNYNENMLDGTGECVRAYFGSLLYREGLVNLANQQIVNFYINRIIPKISGLPDDMFPKLEKSGPDVKSYMDNADKGADRVSPTSVTPTQKQEETGSSDYTEQTEQEKTPQPEATGRKWKYVGAIALVAAAGAAIIGLNYKGNENDNKKNSSGNPGISSTQNPESKQPGIDAKVNQGQDGTQKPADNNTGGTGPSPAEMYWNVHGKALFDSLPEDPFGDRVFVGKGNLENFASELYSELLKHAESMKKKGQYANGFGGFKEEVFAIVYGQLLKDLNEGEEGAITFIPYPASKKTEPAPQKPETQLINWGWEGWDLVKKLFDSQEEDPFGDKVFVVNGGIDNAAKQMYDALTGKFTPTEKEANWSGFLDAFKAKYGDALQDLKAEEEHALMYRQ